MKRHSRRRKTEAAKEKMDALEQKEGAYKAAGEERVKLTNLKGKADSYYDQCQEVQKLRAEATAAEKAWNKAKDDREKGEKGLRKKPEPPCRPCLNRPFWPNR